jgi:hypothetical protein
MSWQRGWGEATPGSDARPVSRGRMVTLSQGELADMMDAAKRRAFTAFARGALAGSVLAACAFVGSAAFGETIHIGRMHVNGTETARTTVSIAPSAKPGELAVVTLQNAYVNDGGDDGTYVLTLDGMTVGIEFLWDADSVLGSDRITVTPPQGVTCEPEDCAVTVMEGFSGTVILIDWRGM